MVKNMSKYFTYRYANEQLKKAIVAGFYLEAITIEESIIVDRLFRFCKDNGLKISASQATLGTIKTCIEKLPIESQEIWQIDFYDELNQFRQNRNTCLHQIAKSEPGEPTLSLKEFEGLARGTAMNGRVLMVKICNWAKRYNRKMELN